MKRLAVIAGLIALVILYRQRRQDHDSISYYAQ